MSDRGKAKPFIVKTEKAFKALPHWLKARGCNTYSWSDGRRINVGYDTRPDSDWGGKYTWRGSIIVCDAGLFDRTLEEIVAAFRKIGAHGWDAEQSK